MSDRREAQKKAADYHMQLRIAGSPYMDLNSRRQLLNDIKSMGQTSDRRDFEHDKLDRKGLDRLKKEVGRFKN